MIRTASLLFALGLVGTAAGPHLPAPLPMKEPEVPLELRKAQLEPAQAVYDARKKQYEAGAITPDSVFEWSRRLFDARIALAASREERIAACRAYVEETKSIEKLTKQRLDAGRAPIADYKAAEYFRVEAEILLFKAEAK